MRKIEKYFLMSSVVMLFCSLLVGFSISAESHANEGDKQFISTTCTFLGGGDEWKCNNCGTGTQICYDHSCIQCQPVIE